MRVWLPTAAAIVVAAILQAALAPHMAIMQVVPNLLLLVVVTLAMVEGPTPGAAAGFAAGLLLDLLGSGPIGPGALVMSSVGYAAGMIGANLFAESWLMPVTVVLIASFVYDLALAALLAVMGVEAALVTIAWRVALPGAVYNTLLAVLIFPWLARFLRTDVGMTELSRLR